MAQGSGVGGWRDKDRELLRRDTVLAGKSPGDIAGGHAGLGIPMVSPLGLAESCVWLEFIPLSPPQPDQVDPGVAAVGGKESPGSAAAQSLNPPSSSTAQGERLEDDRSRASMRPGSSRVVEALGGGSGMGFVSFVAHGEPHGSSMLERMDSHIDFPCYIEFMDGPGLKESI